MFETKSELRKIATITSIITCLAVGLTGCSPQLTEAQQTQLNYLQGKFVNNTYVEGFTPGQPDYGITIEMLMQRAGLYDTSESQATAVTAILEDANLSGSVDNPAGYLFNEGTIKIDLTGKYAFASAALESDNESTRLALVDEASKVFASNPASSTDFAIAWLTLGLEANNRENSIDVAKALVASQNADGGFDDYTPGESTSDATGLALLALGAVQNDLDVKAAVAKAQDYLLNTLKTDHFEAYGSANVNGTAYAFMGLKAVGTSEELLNALQTWLAAQVQPDGGVQAGFAPGASDTMASSQAILAINGKTYLDLLK